VRPRWEGDERGYGISDAAALVPGAEELLAAMRESDWVAEQPEEDLLPHLQRACEQLPLELAAWGVADDATFEVELRWNGEPGAIGAIREAVFALAGSIAESASYLRQRRGEALEFELVTGMLASDGEFAPHGHAVRLRIA
jgi:hypothetical protein